MSTAETLKQLEEFDSHYNYDSTYARELLNYSPDGFAKFTNFLPLSSHQEKLTAEEFWVAKLAGMQVQDCGDCLQLNVKMALEAGVSKEIIQDILKGGNNLADNLKDTYRFAKYLANNELVDIELVERISNRYDKGALLELGICVSTAAVFPTIKRALGYTRSCKIVTIEV